MDAATIGTILEANIAIEARLMSDEHPLYNQLGWAYADHGTTTHSRGEYVSRQDATIHTQTVEGYYSILKRGMKGVYQHCAKKHLHRYAAEFDFRYSYRVALGVNDRARPTRALQGAIGKRLTYRRPAAGGRPRLRRSGDGAHGGGRSLAESTGLSSSLHDLTLRSRERNGGRRDLQELQIRRRPLLRIVVDDQLVDQGIVRHLHVEVGRKARID